MTPRAQRATALVLTLALLGLSAACRPRDRAQGQTDPRSDLAAGSATAPAMDPAAWPERIYFGVTPVLDEESLRRGNQPLCDELGRLLGTKVELYISEGYADLGEHVGHGEVAFGRFSPLAYVVARREQPGLRLVASQIAEGSTDYAAYIVVRADSDITRAAELRGHSFGFVDRTSASGYLYPLVYIADRFGDPHRFFSRVEFLGNHQSLLRAVADGRVDAGATFSAILVTYGSAGLGSPFRIVAKTGRIPYDAFVAGPALDEQQASALQAALLSIDTRSPRGREVLGPLRHINGFLPADDALYDPVREVISRAALHGAGVGTEVKKSDVGP